MVISDWYNGSGRSTYSNKRVRREVVEVTVPAGLVLSH